MEVELTKISEKGQVVIPSGLRKEMGIKKSDKFLVFGEGNTLILKKIEPTSLKNSLSELTRPLQKVISEEGFTKEDLRKAIKNVRKRS
jgi:AbrB family looped-hinge helix DNA binding protein